MSNILTLLNLAMGVLLAMAKLSNVINANAIVGVASFFCALSRLTLLAVALLAHAQN